MSEVDFCRRCGHNEDKHTHYRAGSDCGTCGREVCPAYRTPATVMAKFVFDAICLLGALGLAWLLVQYLWVSP
jgi:hypothetical protein